MLYEVITPYPSSHSPIQTLIPLLFFDYFLKYIIKLRITSYNVCYTKLLRINAVEYAGIYHRIRISQKLRNIGKSRSE